MASRSPPTRIDQFFLAKKKKIPLPSKPERDVKITPEGSPSAKGTLDNYFVISPDNEHKTRHSHTSHVVKESVKRNLALEIDKKEDAISLAHEGSEITESSKNVCEKRSLILPVASSLSTVGVAKSISDDMQGSRNCNVSSIGIAGDAPLDSLEGVEKNLELKQFASDFLSLYCSELQSSVNLSLGTNLCKRKDSPSLLVAEEEFCNKRHCSTTDQCQLEVVVTPTKGNNPKEMQCGSILETVKAIDSGFKELSEMNGRDALKPPTILRKCNMTPKSSISSDKHCTPLNFGVRGAVTPKSMHGSSTFSPGEAFWNEAIQVADGLFAPVECYLVHNKEDANAARSIYEKNSSHIINNEVRDGDNSCVLIRKEDASLRLTRKLGNPLANDVSPLSVKHLDFLSIEKKCNENNTLCSPDYAKDATEVLSVQPIMITPDVEVGKNAARGCDGAATPSSFLPPSDCLDISGWLPPELSRVYKMRGISKLYHWQVDCLRVDGVLQKRNLVYCASTSAGKSLVAEILMLRRVISTGKIALLVLPYVSICTEKAEQLEALLEPIGRHVRGYYGNQGGGTLPKDTSVAVCTIEKANSLINRLLEESRLSEVGIIVIDELHMVGDQNRGYLLELILTKLRYATGEGNIGLCSGESSGSSSGKADPSQGLQIIGMSATMPNVAAVADWLQAALYQTDFRPVPLEEFIKVGNTIYDRKMEIVRTISKTTNFGGKDPEHIVELCHEVVQDGHSVLMFCSSRKGCESTARHISKFLAKPNVNVHSDKSGIINITSAIDALRKCPAGLDSILEETLPCGVAYHHAGLTVEEREIIEGCYRKGIVHVLTATSTLAAGVNLPARRVIFRQPRIGCEFIDGTRYKQMAGRAGRTGIDTKGESVLICKPEEVKKIMRVLNESCPPLLSCLSEDKNGMTHAILEVVAAGIVQSASDIHRYVKCTLLNSTQPFHDVVKSAQDSLRWLCHRKFLLWNEDSKLYSSTPLGRAAFGSALSPEESLTVLDDLLRAREGFVLASDLHVVYLITPINVDVEPDWELFYEKFMGLSTLDQFVGNRVGVLEPFLMRMAHGAPIHNSKRTLDNKKQHIGKSNYFPRNSNSGILSDQQTLRVCKRFYVALILSRLVQEVPVIEVCDSFKVARGMVQSLQENAGRFASMVSVFCERLSWHDLEGLVSKFQNRVSFGVRAEIVELTTIPYVKGSRARALYNAGFRTPLAIAEAHIPEIVKVIFESSSWAEQELAQRRMQLGVAKKIKNGARKIVLDKAEESRIAAFSAFKSLGLNVPQFSRPLLNSIPGNTTESSGEDSTSSLIGSVQAEPVLGNENHDKDALDNDGVKSAVLSTGNTKTVQDVSMIPALQSNFVAENPTAGDALISIVDHTENVGLVPVLVDPGDEIKACNVLSADQGVQELPRNENVGVYGKVDIHDKGPLNAVNVSGGFDSFLNLWESSPDFYFDIHFNKRLELNSAAPFEIHGIAICWENSPVYYVNLPKDLHWSDKKGSELFGDELLEITSYRWNRIGKILGRKDVRKFAWNLKIQIQVLRFPAVSIQRFGHPNIVTKNKDLEIVENLYYMLPPVNLQGVIDLCIVSWILWPDEERSSTPNLEKEIKKKLPSEVAAAAQRNGRWKNQMRRTAHNGCCRRVSLTRALCSFLWKLVVSEQLLEALMSTETPLVNVLADMEIWGIGVDMEKCIHARHVLGKKLRCLEKEAYQLAGMTFSLYTTADVANVLYGHMKLPLPEGSNKGKQHPSTDKHCLDNLRNEHPIVSVIQEHRSLSKLMNCTLGSIFSLARLSLRTQKYTLHGHWLQMSTSTGRLSMEEPNLQTVEHMVEFKSRINNDKGDSPDSGHHKINARDFLVPTQEKWLLLTADYSQIELRLMAHFSKDPSLINLLNSRDGDVFTMIAAKWRGNNGESSISITPQDRDQAKRLVYGILYGMGAKTLAAQLGCTSDEANEKIQSFRTSFPGVASWLCETIASCHRKGYVKTVKGRKRFLSKIKFGNSTEKSKAQRQAVNSICQGSAADIIKVAMINIYSVIVEGVENPNFQTRCREKFGMLKNRCRILLQVHDELVLEADPLVIKEAGSLLQMSMENAARLLVPLHVKLKVGRTWGSMDPLVL